ncbi:TPA_asm: MFS transporter [Salmonella enterica subsp. enterica serovar Typhi str. CT18]|nr:MFS transporter [Salmonella enterica subsp. enterica serovar Typhi str. CT18]HAD4797399.1 MFS transporter [Salmonella enterica subsp. enterica serovar Typhi str. CT18]
MSDTSSALPESPESVGSHNALSTGQQTVINKLFRRLIVFLFVLFIFSFLDRINIGFAGLTMGQDLGLSATMFGLATTLFYATYVIFGIPSNVMLSIVGARRWIATIMVLWGIASTATMFAVGPKSLYVLRMLVGITEAGFLPGILLYLTYWFPAFFRARANALFMIAMPATTALGSIVSGYILSLDGIFNLHGWQWLFLLEGFPSVLLGIMVWFYLDDTPAKAKWLTAEDKKCLQEMMDNDRLSLADKLNELAALKHYWQLIERESTEQLAGCEHTLVLLAQAVFTLLLRNAKLDDHAATGMRGELKLFQRFTLLIDNHFHQHWTVPDYACELHITESRLTDICRRFANRPPKRLIFDRQLREAKRLLLFSDNAVNEIAWQLGFKDPAYFARFFNRLAGCSPSQFRQREVPSFLN